MSPALRLLTATSFVLAALTAGCSSSSSGGSCSTADGGTCAAIAAEIVAHGGGPSTCTAPVAPNFQQACAAYESCLKQCGQ